MRSAALLVLLAACAPRAARPLPPHRVMLVDASGAPASGWSGPLVEPCRAMLADAFPDTPADAWSIAECGDLGVLASDGVDDFAVTGDGSIWHVDACGWTLLADGQ